MIIFGTSGTVERFSVILEGLCRAVAARIAGRAMSAAVIVLVWQRIRQVERRLLGMLARFRAGRLRIGRAAGVRTGLGRRSGGSAGLPRGFGWLLALVPHEAAGFAGQLRVVLAEPEMAALIAAAPQARRVLGPLCRMLGIEAEVIAVAAGASAAAGAVVAYWDVDGDGGRPGVRSAVVSGSAERCRS